MTKPTQPCVAVCLLLGGVALGAPGCAKPCDDLSVWCGRCADANYGACGTVCSGGAACTAGSCSSTTPPSCDISTPQPCP